MKQLLVVVGSVTSKQYAYARNALLKQGITPDVVRLTEEYWSLEFMPAAIRLVEQVVKGEMMRSEAIKLWDEITPEQCSYRLWADEKHNMHEFDEPLEWYYAKLKTPKPRMLLDTVAEGVYITDPVEHASALNEIAVDLAGDMANGLIHWDDQYDENISASAVIMTEEFWLDERSELFKQGLYDMAYQARYEPQYFIVRKNEVVPVTYERFAVK